MKYLIFLKYCFFINLFFNLENYKSNKTNAATKDTSHRHDKALPAIRRLQNEPDEDYLRRVNRITHASIRESQFESKYGVEVIRNQRGEITIKKRPVDELGEAMKAARRRQKKNGGKDDEEEDEVAAKKRKRREAAEAKKMTDAERKKLVKEMMVAKKKAKAVAAEKAVEYKTDVVAFGEVTHGPPQLVTPRRAQKADTVPRVSRTPLPHIFFISKSIFIFPSLFFLAWCQKESSASFGSRSIRRINRKTRSFRR